MIVDNLAAHKTKAVEAFLEAHSRVHLHFTPTYASWLNQVELWFNKIERDLLARGIFTSLPISRVKSDVTSHAITKIRNRFAGPTAIQRIELLPIQLIQSAAATIRGAVVDIRGDVNAGTSREPVRRRVRVTTGKAVAGATACRLAGVRDAGGAIAASRRISAQAPEDRQQLALAPAKRLDEVGRERADASTSSASPFAASSDAGRATGNTSVVAIVIS